MSPEEIQVLRNTYVHIRLRIDTIRRMNLFEIPNLDLWRLYLGDRESTLQKLFNSGNYTNISVMLPVLAVELGCLRKMIDNRNILPPLEFNNLSNDMWEGISRLAEGKVWW